MKLYVASSWRNGFQQTIVRQLREAGHEVYDFRNPPGRTGFSWSAIQANWKNWTNRDYRSFLGHPIAIAGFDSDFDAMKDADGCVLVLPSGRSAHIEAGYFVGAGKPIWILLMDQQEPELMYKMATDICLSPEELLTLIGNYSAPPRTQRETAVSS